LRIPIVKAWQNLKRAYGSTF